MSWFNVWDGLKNKTCRYLLQRYLGQFLDEKLNLEQLNIELYNGKATIKNVSLRVEALNELLDAQGWPFEFTDGQVGLLTVSVPWNALMTNDSSIEASDVVLCLRPVKRAHEGHESMIESMWSSVSSSLQLAEECMRQEEDDESECTATSTGVQAGSIVGLEKFAETIDNVLNRIQAKFSNITLKIEYPCHYRLRGVALNIHLNELFYKNETGSEKMPQMSSTESATQSDHVNRLPTYAKHTVNLNGVSMFTQENWVSDSECGVQHEDIPILQFMGQQNLQIKVKQSEDITGPKICFDVELGAICAIFSPRQLQLLTHFLEAFSEEESYRAVKQRNEAHYADDFESQQQQQEIYDSNLAHGNLNMWPHGPPTATNVARATPSNLYRNCDNYCDSIASSSLSSSTITSVSRNQRKATNIDSSAEISNFVIKITALVGVILHEDILVESDSNSYQHFWNERSLKDLLKVSQNFFEYTANTPIERELSSPSLYCSKNHLFLRLNPIVAEGKQNRNKNILQITTSITATKVELCEVLEEQVTHLLKFNRNKNCFNGYQIRPEFTMNFSSSNSIRMTKNSRTSIDIMLEENILEFDITIIDRLGSFFAPSPYSNYSARAQSPAREDLAASKTEFSINCALVDVKLRFPIVDLRPLHDPNRVPWWKQNIRTDYLLLRFSEFKLLLSESCVKLYASQIEIFYAETEEVQNHLLTTTYNKLKQHTVLEDYPLILVDFADRNYATLEAGSEPKLPFSSKRHCRQSSTSAYSNKMDNDLTENILLPGDKHEIDEFCETTMANSEIQVKLNFPVVDFFVESKQLYELIYNRLNADLFMWEPSCPYITKSSAMETHQQMGQSLLNMGLMDSVYISAIAQSDAFSEPYEQQTQSLSSNKRSVVLEQSDQSDDNQEQEDDLEIDDDDDDGISCKQQPPQTFAAKISHHNCSVEIMLGKVSGSCFVPVRDNDKHILPQVCGKFLLNVERVKIFLVAGFKNNMNLSYLSTQIKSGEIYHCGIVPMNTPLRFDHQAQVEDFMQSTLYKIPHGLTKGIVIPEGDNDMFSVVIEMKKNPAQKIKRVKITAGIRYATLRYNPSSSTLYWLNQLIDFLDVADYPIEGYKQYSVLSEMQLHLWDCAIDFRPENFSYRAVLEMFYFSVCSNIIPSMPCCNLRFVLEECVLSLAPYEESTHKKYPCYKVSCIDAKNLVPVLDVGLLDISLRLNDEETDKCPTFDLRCSIHDVHFRTCYDSGSAFAQLIGYMASNSNTSNEQPFTKEQSLQSSLSSESDFFLSQTEQQLTKEITKKQQERVNILMAEAVQESPEEKRTLQTIDEEPIRGKDELKLFYFPDENNKHLTKQQTKTETQAMDKSTIMAASSSADTGETLPIVKADFGDITEDDSALFEDLHTGSSNEEDYCIIAEEEKVFVNTKFASSSIEVSDDPLMIVDNHFCLPSSSSNDLLRTPSNFPMPEQRYTLCEMTFTWHLYGGHDFPPSSTASTTSNASAAAAAAGSGETSANKTAMSDTYRQGVFYANESSRLQQVKKPKEKLTWKSVGGSNRNHEVLVEMQFTKVRFSYETYPRHTTYASRQVLVVNEIEIRDRLQSSEINKFLYNANTKSFSNRRNQHMVLVKAIHVRPNPQQNNNQECSLRISLCPLRVHIDQDTLEFLTDFFTNFGKACDKDNLAEATLDEGKQCKLALAKTELPIMTINEDEQEIPDAVNDLRARRIVNENISLLIDEQESADSRSIKSDSSVVNVSQEVNTAPIFFREIIFTPDVSIRFDYHGRRVELSKGPIAGLLMGLGQLQCSEIILRKIIYRRGLLGFEKVCNYLCKEWLRDIKRNQLPKILSGVGPTYAFVQLFQGIYDLFWLPIEHYQKDGRLIRGLQLGAQSFSARTILAALEITSRLIQLLQFTAETAFDMVSSGPSVRQSKKNKRGRKKRHNRPKDIREGVANAYQILKDGINDSANNLIETAAAEHDQKGLTGAVGAVMRQVPQLVVCPAVLATQATTNILGGVKSSLVPEAKLEAKEKWKDNNC